MIGRLYAVVIFLLFSAFSCYYVYSRPFSAHHSFLDPPQPESLWINKTWTDYLESCAGEKIIENQVHALHLFTQTYENNIVDWDGYYIDTKIKQKGPSLLG